MRGKGEQGVGPHTPARQKAFLSDGYTPALLSEWRTRSREAIDSHTIYTTASRWHDPLISPKISPP